MIKRRHRKLSMARQCRLIGWNRSTWYYRRRGTSDGNLRLMRLLDEAYLKMPWYGSRQMVRHLKRLGYRVSRKRVRRLMRLMGLRSVAPWPYTARIRICWETCLCFEPTKSGVPI